MSYTLSKLEKKVLFKKYVSDNNSIIESRNKLNNVKLHLKGIRKIKKNNKIKSDDTDKKFKEKFKKIKI